jgi:murein DD-endopeptidase MepM/ murein hydrolase activator NlpD
VIRVFPVAAEGAPHFSDDFGVIRAGGTPHKGNDLFAAEGTPIVAVDDGAVRFVEDPIGGHAFYLAADDRTVYYGAHLSAYEGTDRRVQAGEVIGYVGQTGNAARTSPHLHFEVHPSGGVAVDPYRLLVSMPPPTVTSSLGAVDQVLPPAPPGEDPLPPIAVVPGPVPNIPRARSSAAGPLAFVALVAGVAFTAARGRRRR